MRRHWIWLGALVVLLTVCRLAAAKDPTPSGYVPAPKDQSKAQLAAMPKPDYPTEYRRRGYEAHMGLRIFVSADGRIDRVESTGFRGDWIIVDHAIAYIRQNWRFRPFSVRGKAAAVVFVVPISFELQNGKLRNSNPVPSERDTISSIIFGP
jgi:outer membrane biosynthesis protein TonB